MLRESGLCIPPPARLKRLPTAPPSAKLSHSLSRDRAHSSYFFLDVMEHGHVLIEKTV